MNWQICVLHASHVKAFAKGKLVPLEAWVRKKVIKANSYVTADKRARKLYKGRYVHTYIIN